MIAAALIAGCSNQQAPSSSSTPSIPPQVVASASAQEKNNVSMLSDSDTEVNRAIDKARATVLDFLKVLGHPAADQTDFAVTKRCVGSDGQKEDLWLTDLSYDGTVIHGVIDNEPEFVTSLHLGDAATVAPADIIDWKYLDHNKLVGGYTIRAYYYEGTPDEKADILKQYTPDELVRNY